MCVLLEGGGRKGDRDISLVGHSDICFGIIICSHLMLTSYAHILCLISQSYTQN